VNFITTEIFIPMTIWCR